MIWSSSKLFDWVSWNSNSIIKVIGRSKPSTKVLDSMGTSFSIFIGSLLNRFKFIFKLISIAFHNYLFSRHNACQWLVITVSHITSDYVEKLRIPSWRLAFSRLIFFTDPTAVGYVTIGPSSLTPPMNSFMLSRVYWLWSTKRNTSLPLIS